MNSTRRTNRLERETSPYLLQHAFTPVDWYPWGDEAFAKARSEDKSVLREHARKRVTAAGDSHRHALKRSTASDG